MDAPPATVLPPISSANGRSSRFFAADRHFAVEHMNRFSGL